MDEHHPGRQEMSLPSFLRETAARSPDFIATTLEVDMTYGELNERVNRFAQALIGLGFAPGDRVALVLPNVPAAVISAYGILKIGAIVVNLNVMARGEELRRCLVGSGARAVVTLDVLLRGVMKAAERTSVETVIVQSVTPARVEEAAGDRSPRVRSFLDLLSAHPGHEPEGRVDGDDLAVIQYTSGATGAPKAVALSHRNLVSNVLQLEEALPHEDYGNGAVLCLLPFFHVFGMTTCLHLSVRKGYRMVLVPRFDWSSVLKLMGLIEEHQPVSLPAVPPLWAALVSHRGAADLPLSSIKIPSAGGAPLPRWVQERFHVLTGKWIVEGYGLSETSSTTHMSGLDRPPVPGSIGRPLRETEARIVDVETGEVERPVGEVGELLVRGPQVMRGYWNDPERTAAALREGWLHTGDLARRDEEGNYFIVDRKDDLIISSGYNVSPVEVEAALMAFPGVKEVAVVGTPNAIRGQTVVAVVVPDGSAPVEAGALRDHCRSRLAGFKVPGEILFREALPRNPAGKLLRRLLRDELIGS